jgi:hypothetical protein
MSVQRLDLLLLGKLVEDAPRLSEGVVEPAQELHEPGPALEELRELFRAQLPR